MANKDFYKLLGVARDASDDEIRRAYRKLARELHPDVTGDDPKAKERFLQVQEAYAVLSNKEKRGRYDRFGTADFQGPPGGGGWHRGRPGAQGFADVNIDDLFGGGGIFGDLFSQGAPGGFRTRRPRGPARGQDVNYELRLGFEQAVGGTTSEITLAPPGGGRPERIEVKIPPGVTEGQKIRLKGKGQPSPMGGPAGDLYIVARIAPHPYFRREGAHIYLDLPLSIVGATLGAKVTIPTLDGPTTLTVPPGTRSGQKLRLRGKGAPDPKGNGRGDQYAVIAIVPPTGLDEKTRKQLKQLGQELNQDPRADTGWQL